MQIIKRSKALLVMLAFLIAFAPMAVWADAGKKEKINYVALGDSLAAGTLNNGSLGVGYVGDIVKELESSGYEVSVENKGENGFTTADVLAGLEDNAAKLANADIITISAGANDVLTDLIALIRQNPELLENFEAEYLTEAGIAQLYQAMVEAKGEAEAAAIEALTAKGIAQENVKTAKTDIIETGAAANVFIAGLKEQLADTPIWIIAEGIINELEDSIATAVDSVSKEIENIDEAALENASEALQAAVGLIESVEEYIPDDLKENVQDAVTAAENAKSALIDAKAAENIASEARKTAEEAELLFENVMKAVQVFEGIPEKAQAAGENIGEILGFIKQINQTADIYIMGYYNALPYLDENVTQPLLNGLNEAIKLPAGIVGANFVPTAHLFEANNYLPDPYNIHPNEAGYKAIANTFMEQISKSFPEIIEPEEPTEQQINLGEETVVSKGQWIYINETNVSILLPDDLPEGTTLTVTTTDEELLAKADDLKQIGDVLNFTFHFPAGFEDFAGNYQLVMGYDHDTEEAADIYYFNESTSKWESQKAEVNPETKEMSLIVSHFSNYGVFSKVEQPEKPKDKEDPPAKKPIDKSDKDENDDESTAGAEEKQDVKEAGILPSTATNHYNLIGVGILLIGLAIVTWYMQRKRQQTE